MTIRKFVLAFTLRNRDAHSIGRNNNPTVINAVPAKLKIWLYL